MTTRLDSRGFLSGRPGRQIFAAAFVTALLVFAACVYVWIDLGGGAWYGEAHVKEAEFHPPDRLRLILDSCYEFQEGRGSRRASRPNKGRGGRIFHIPTGDGIAKTTLMSDLDIRSEAGR